MMLYISAMFWCIVSGEFLISSIEILSEPGLLLDFNLLAAFLTLFDEKGISIGLGGIAGILSASFQNILLKDFVIISACFFGLFASLFQFL